LACINTFSILANFVSTAFNDVTGAGSISDSESVTTLASLAFKSLAHVLTVFGVGAELRIENGWEEIWALFEFWIRA
jgi:hypothetical protein